MEISINKNVRLEENENKRRLHIGSFFVDLNGTDYLELLNLSSSLNWKTFDKNKIINDYFNAWVYSDIVEYATWNPHSKKWQDVEGFLIKNVTDYSIITIPNPPKKIIKYGRNSKINGL